MAELRTSEDPIGEAAQLVADALRTGDRLAIPGGSAAAVVGRARDALGARWTRVRLTWVDERCVPFEHEDSNRGLAYRKGFLSPGRAPRLELALGLDGESIDESLARVREGLSEDFRGGLDCVLLGMGEDGHIASLFPGHPSMHATGEVALVTGSPKPPSERFTLTRALLATATRTVLFATGKGKRDALSRVLAGDPALPASNLPGLVVVTDVTL